MGIQTKGIPTSPSAATHRSQTHTKSPSTATHQRQTHPRVAISLSHMRGAWHGKFPFTHAWPMASRECVHGKLGHLGQARAWPASLLPLALHCRACCWLTARAAGSPWWTLSPTPLALPPPSGLLHLPDDCLGLVLCKMEEEAPLQAFLEEACGRADAWVHPKASAVLESASCGLTACLDGVPLLLGNTCHAFVMGVSWDCHGSVMGASWECRGSVMAGLSMACLTAATGSSLPRVLLAHLGGPPGAEARTLSPTPLALWAC